MKCSNICMFNWYFQHTLTYGKCIRKIHLKHRRSGHSQCSGLALLVNSPVLIKKNNNCLYPRVLKSSADNTLLNETNVMIISWVTNNELNGLPSVNFKVLWILVSYLDPFLVLFVDCYSKYMQHWKCKHKIQSFNIPIR